MTYETTDARAIVRAMTTAAHRAERAAWYGDHAGALIAAADANRLRAQLRRAERHPDAAR